MNFVLRASQSYLFNVTHMRKQIDARSVTA